MKNFAVSMLGRDISKASYAFWIIVTILSLAVLIYSGYRLITFDPYEQIESQSSLLDQLEDDLQKIQPLVLLFNIAEPQAQAPIAEELLVLMDKIEGEWDSVSSTNALRQETVNLAQANYDEFFSSVRERISGQRSELNVAALFVSALDNLDLMRLDLLAQTGNPFSDQEVIITFLATLLLALGLSALAYLFNRDAKRRLEASVSENSMNQMAILRLLDELADLADGDLTISASVTEDFTGAIADSINFTIDQLRQLVSRINTTAIQVSRASQNSRQTALHLAEASDHQAQEIAGASAAINEMAVTIDQVSSNAAESALVAGKSVSIANNGAKLVQNTIQGMDTIREQIQDTSKRIKRLGESSQEIGDIVSLINDIADQTNILALNAAIQASMAGDAGRGFAVVADEVQRLAERSAAATKQIETLVKTIQTDTNEAVISMEQTTTEVVNGARLAQDAGVALEEIEGVSVNLAELIQNISNAARQQASSAGHISNTMNVIQEITTQTSSGTSETAESIGELAQMAAELRGSVSDFTLPADMLEEIGHVDVPPLVEDVSDLGAGDENFFEKMDGDSGNDLGLDAELGAMSADFDQKKFNKSVV